MPIPIQLALRIQAQPSDTSCGPTCLHAVYRYWADPIPLGLVVEEVGSLPSGGTLGVLLALHALRRGYRGLIYTCNLKVFDPTWFDDRGRALPHLAERLKRRGELASVEPTADPRMPIAAQAYLDYLALGGEVRMVDPTAPLIAYHLSRGEPMLVGLSATWLYRQMRVDGPDDHDDDVRGMPMGHFVVLNGYDPGRQCVWISDPSREHPHAPEHHYEISIERLICAILLGIVTYDANLLILSPEARSQP